MKEDAEMKDVRVRMVCVRVPKMFRGVVRWMAKRR